MFALLVLGFYLSIFFVAMAAAGFANSTYPAREEPVKFWSLYAGIYVPVIAWMTWVVILVSPIVRSL